MQKKKKWTACLMALLLSMACMGYPVTAGEADNAQSPDNKGNVVGTESTMNPEISEEGQSGTLESAELPTAANSIGDNNEPDGNVSMLRVSGRANTYHVLYSFKVGTRGASLIDEITNLLPMDSESYAMGETVNAIMPAKTEFWGPKSNSSTAAIGLWTFEGYDADSKIVSDDTLEEGDSLTDDKLYIRFMGTWKWQAKTPSVTITAQDMTSYTGGDSISGDSFPTARFKVEASDGVDLSEVSMTVNGTDYMLPEGTQSGDIVLLPWLDDTFALQESSDMGALTRSGGDLAADDAQAGVYEIGIAQTPTAKLNDSVNVDISYEPGTLTVRNVSEPDAVIAGNVDIAQPVVTQESDVDTEDGIGMAVISEGTSFYTNGKSELQVLGDNDSTEPQIALLFDELLPGENGEDTAGLLLERAEEDGYSLTKDNAQFKYLDLINENDGNAWVSTNDGSTITIYWPCPEGINPEEYDFQVLHYKGLHREYRGDLENQIDNAEIEEINATVSDGNIVFELSGNQQGGSFSPFVVSWEKNASTNPGETPGSGTENKPGTKPEGTPNKTEPAKQTTAQQAVKTGDYTDVTPWSIVFAASGISAVAAGIFVKRRRIR